ncbi:hypothetical protein GQ55_5G283900 [Panicum hallii var. hallii]|uniref:Uncharacterized protein n=1 Tax=Panicum hallii var. hallii TaxID=1504633 RepID=A0A2T7DL30_9POAL|nr:hypothetical protein GQ55_5G283900 [Panicum hallii var. hallii]
MPLVVVCLCRKPKGAYELWLDVRAGEPYIVQDAHAFKLQRCCAEDLVLFMKLSLVKRGSLRSLYTTWWILPSEISHLNTNQLRLVSWFSYIFVKWICPSSIY